MSDQLCACGTFALASGRRVVGFHMRRSSPVFAVRAVLADRPWPNPAHYRRVRVAEFLRRGLVGILTEVRDHALRARGCACNANIASVQKEPVMSVLQVLFRSCGHESVFDRARCLARRETRTVRDPKNMSVDG